MDLKDLNRIQAAEAKAEALQINYAPDPMDLPLKLWLARLTNGISPASVTLAYADWLSHLISSPSKQSQLASSAARSGLQWMNFAAQNWHGECAPCITPAPNDKRFVAPDWKQPPFQLIAQGFLLQQRWWGEAMTGVRGVSHHHQDVVDFTMRQWLDMWSPSNFLATNPQLIKETVSRAGQNLVHGSANWMRDMVAVLTEGPPRGVDAFEPGRGVALTPGKVVYRNELIELIQYEPTTPDVASEPLLIIPSWIMKYYILDLTPDDSLVKYMVGQGHTVFIVSWKNPGREDRTLGMDDYLGLGVMAAIEAVRHARPNVGIHAMGYCLGGTLLGIAAAVLGASQRNPLITVSLLAGQVDFHKPGELGLFIDESQIAFLEGLMAEHGYLDGRQMAGAFQLINSKDLVWSKLVQEYLMGAQSPMTAMKAWNADATRLPARMHSEYLRRLYLHNDLSEGRYPVRGQPVRLSDIALPLFAVATERDHVSPWESVYKIHHLVRAPVSFVLTSGGHNVGIVNPPTGPLAHPSAFCHFAEFAPGKAPAHPEEWLNEAPEQPGSWWPLWDAWLKRHASGQRIKPPRIAALMNRGKPLLAPGTYVHQH
jgi:polyhydroxyalkanoate synthase